MKLKLITFLLGITTIILGITTCIYYLKTESRTELLADRELTITNYKKVISAIGKSGGVSINKLKAELKEEFEFDEKIGYYDYYNEYYYVLYPKQYDVNSREIWEFMGLDLILDEQKKFKTVNMHKP